jgi:hypothetical protein
MSAPAFYKYNDGLLPGGRRPTLWLVGGGEIHHFRGQNIPGVAVIRHSEYEKSGKWSNTTYQIEVSPKYTPVRLVAPLHGRVWPQATLTDAYEHFLSLVGRRFAVSRAVFEVALEKDFPKAFTRLLEGERALFTLAPDGGGRYQVSLSLHGGSKKKPSQALVIFRACEDNPDEEEEVCRVSYQELLDADLPYPLPLGVGEVIDHCEAYAPAWRRLDLVLALDERFSVEAGDGEGR